ncbi:MAG: hypothetical protein CL484_11710 [Acidobacteria bacterium]|nr:hypothetical protein [Acidobacteriota bacterium]
MLLYTLRKMTTTSLNLALVMLAALTTIASAQPQRRQVETNPWPDPDPAPWLTVSAGDSGFDLDRLEQAASLAEPTHADALLVIRHGRIVLERYWNGRKPTDVQQTYSTTKGAVAFLVGRVLERGHIESLDQSIANFVPEIAGQTRENMTFRNVMAMQSGLAQWPALDRADRQSGRSQLEAVGARGMTHQPFQYFIYSSTAYRLLFTALERATGMNLPDLSRKEIFGPLGMTGAYWVEIHSQDRFLGYQSIRMRPRDMAKLGQVLLNNGHWKGSQYLPTGYMQLLRTAPAPKINPSYGLFWHLNSGEFYLSYRESNYRRNRLLPGSPPDTIVNFGNGGQIIAIVPSLDLVWTRTGRQIPSNIWSNSSTVAQLSAAIIRAVDH